MGEWIQGARAGGVAGQSGQRPPRPAEQLGVDCGELEGELDSKAPIAPHWHYA